MYEFFRDLVLKPSTNCKLESSFYLIRMTEIIWNYSGLPFLQPIWHMLWWGYKWCWKTRLWKLTSCWAIVRLCGLKDFYESVYVWCIACFFLYLMMTAGVINKGISVSRASITPDSHNATYCLSFSPTLPPLLPPSLMEVRAWILSPNFLIFVPLGISVTHFASPVSDAPEMY